MTSAVVTKPVPVTTMEEIVVLSDEERASLLASLAAAEKEIADGGGAPYDREEMRRRFEVGLARNKSRPPRD